MPSAGALLSDCGRYRYRLWRDLPVLPFAKDLGRILFLMVNPSTADARKSDRTTDKCIALATLWGFSHLDLANLFAWRSRRVEDLLTVADPVGERTDIELKIAVREARRVVLAWGTHKPVRALIEARVPTVVEILRTVERELARDGDPPIEIGHLGTCEDGSPKHPLFLPKSTQFHPIDLQVFPCS